MIDSEFQDRGAPHLPRPTDTLSTSDPHRNVSGKAQFWPKGVKKPDPIDDPRLHDPEYADYSIKKGDEVYAAGWTLTPLYVVDVNWALRAIAVRLGHTGDIVIWSVMGKVKRHD